MSDVIPTTTSLSPTSSFKQFREPYEDAAYVGKVFAGEVWQLFRLAEKEGHRFTVEEVRHLLWVVSERVSAAPRGSRYRNPMNCNVLLKRIEA